MKLEHLISVTAKVLEVSLRNHVLNSSLKTIDWFNASEKTTDYHIEAESKKNVILM